MYQGMFLGTAREITLLLYAALTGALLGAVYDILRALRISIRHSTLAVAAEDFVFCILFGAVYYSFCVQFTEGALRMFLLVGMIAGLGLYLVSLGRIICGVLGKAFGMAARLCTYMVKIIKKFIKFCAGCRFFRNIKNN